MSPLLPPLFSALGACAAHRPPPLSLSQVPLLAWAGEVPLIGSNLQKAMVGKAAMVTATIFGRSGEQLFLQDDDGTDGQPLIEALTKDDSLGNRFFMSGLKSFRTRTAYANVRSQDFVLPGGGFSLYES